MIKVTETYYIKADDRQYTVMKQTFNKDKQEYNYNPLSYPSNLTGAVERIMKLVQADKLDEHDMSLSEALKVCKEINREFKEILNEIKEQETL